MGVCWARLNGVPINWRRFEGTQDLPCEGDPKALAHIQYSLDRHHPGYQARSDGSIIFAPAPGQDLRPGYNIRDSRRG